MLGISTVVGIAACLNTKINAENQISLAKKAFKVLVGLQDERQGREEGQFTATAAVSWEARSDDATKRATRCRMRTRGPINQRM